ncbi:Uncharacterised protein [Citrobacter koseri]|nr:Uncharacterised protein [Citrobacter koseri]
MVLYPAYGAICRPGKRKRHPAMTIYSFANTRRAASMVLLISSMLCATDIKPASKADGAR